MIINLNSKKRISTYHDVPIYIGEKNFDEITVLLPGRIGDNGTDELTFVLHLVKPNGEYLTKTMDVGDRDGRRIASMIVTAGFTNVAQDFFLYLEMTKGNDVIGKTNVITVKINPLPGETDRIIPVEEYEETIDELTEIIQANTAAMERINGFSDGEDGFSPAATVTKSGGVATITITDKDGMTTVQISDGDKGDKGDTGAQGIQGEQGPKGDKGDTGVTGPQGVQGEKGDKGDKGDTGATGAAGADGYSPIASVSKSGNITTITITDKNGTTTATVSDGAKGDKGDKGDTGAQGIQGVQGEKGDTGNTGATGADGKSAYQVAVDNGFVGTQSEWLASLKGDKGDKGDTGDAGDAGAPGAKGDKGDTGETGAKGDTGAQGAKGDKGDPGNDGYSPTAAVSKSNGVATISITDKNGTTTVTVFDGAKGDKGDKGDTGDTPDISGNFPVSFEKHSGLVDSRDLSLYGNVSLGNYHTSIPVSEGERYIINCKSSNAYYPGAFYTLNGTKVSAIFEDNATHLNAEITVPSGVDTLWLNSKSTIIPLDEWVIYQIVEAPAFAERNNSIILTLQQQRIDEELETLRRLKELEKRDTFRWKTFDKAYYAFVNDGSKKWLHVLYDVFHSHNAPLCAATVGKSIELANDTETSPGGRTVKQTLDAIVADGGEVMVYLNAEQLLATDPFEAWYEKAVKEGKHMIESYGYRVRGLILSLNSAHNSAVGQEICERFFDYADRVGSVGSQYDIRRKMFADIDNPNPSTIADVKAYIDVTAGTPGFYPILVHGPYSEQWATDEGMDEILSYIENNYSSVAEVSTYSDVFDRFRTNGYLTLSDLPIYNGGVQ